MNCLLTSTTKYCCSVWFSSVVAKSATRTSCDSGGHESWIQVWSTPLIGAVLGVRRHSKASDAMLEHNGVRRLDPRATRYFLQVRKPADEPGRHESETPCANSREESKLPKRGAKVRAPPARRPPPELAGDRPKKRRAPTPALDRRRCTF